MKSSQDGGKLLAYSGIDPFAAAMKPANRPQSPVLPKEPIAIFVHGTFASASEPCPDDPGRIRYRNKGKYWWQQESPFWHKLKSWLGDHPVTLPHSQKEHAEHPYFEPGSHVFHWSGENSERARFAASQSLLDKLEELEMENQPYHLVGHSHGGSIIWGALQESVFRRWRPCSRKKTIALQLKNLRSWTTVGTPFFQFKESMVATWLGGLPPLALLLLLIVNFSLLVTVALYEPGNAAAVTEQLDQASTMVKTSDSPQGADEGIVAEVAQEAAQTIRWGALEMLRKVWRKIRSLAEEVPGLGGYLKKHQWEGLFWSLLACFVLGTVYGKLKVERLEALEVKALNRCKRQAMREFGKRWMGIWSRQDEAINGLKMSIKLTSEAPQSLLAPMEVPTTKVFRSDGFARFTIFEILVRMFVKPAWNRVFRPWMDKGIWGLLGQKAVGLDRPGCCVKRVSHTPTGMLEDCYDGYHLRVKRNTTLAKLPRKGIALLIVGEFSGGLHVRIFDRYGEMIVDKSEDAFAPAPDALATLKERLGTERNGEVDEQTREEIFRAVCRLATHNPRNMCIRKEVDDEIIRGANDQLLRRMSGDLLTETREALANYSQGVNAFAAVARAGEALMGPELVHNSYFDCPAVVELIGRHMVEEDFLGLAEEPRSVPVSPETREWMAAFRGLADGETACFETRHRGTEMALPRLGEPNRWAMGTLFFWILPFATPLFITTGLAATSSTMAVNEIFHLGLLVWGGLLMFPGWIVTLPMACVARNRARNGARRGAIAEVMFATTLLWTILWCLGLLLILLGPHLYNFVVVELLGKG